MSSTTWPEAGQVVLGQRPALAGLADAGDRLVAVERLGGAGALHHGELHQLEGGEPLLAVLAAAPAADRAAVLGDPRVEDLGVGVAAERAVHRRSSSRWSVLGARFTDPGEGCGYLGSCCVEQPSCLWVLPPSVWGLDVDNYIGVSTRCSGDRTPRAERRARARRVILIWVTRRRVCAGQSRYDGRLDHPGPACRRRTDPAANDLQMPRWGQARGRCGSDHGDRGNRGRRTPESRGSPCPATPIA